MTEVRRFPVHLGRWSRYVLRLWGVDASNAWVDLGDDELEASFGRFRFQTPVSNVARWRIEGPWWWIRAIGVRRSLRHGDITFGGTARGGVRLDFHERVPWTVFQVPAFYVTVDDMAGFTAALTERGIPGEDARRRPG